MVDEKVEVHKKRLETVDGVEIASSYKEYVELAIDDINDRMTKNTVQLNYTLNLLGSREKLFSNIDLEISRIKSYIEELLEKLKSLRDRLRHNTRMKAALVELAKIAGFSLKDKQNLPILTSNENKTMLKRSLATTLLLDRKNGGYKMLDNNTYNQYIEMAYAEVNSVLASDKQMLLEVIRQKKDNAKRLKMLEALKLKVENSLKRFKLRADKLTDLIKKQTEIRNVLTQLKIFMQHHKINLNFLNFAVSSNQVVVKELETSKNQSTDSPAQIVNEENENNEKNLLS